MEHVCTGIVVGLNSFIDLVYADDTALFLPHDQDSTEIQSSFSPQRLRLVYVSWAKTKQHNLGCGPRPAAVSVNDNHVEPVDTFNYLGR